MAENLFGHVEQASGNLDAARERFTRSVEQFQTLSSPWVTGNALPGMAGVALATGDVDTADRVLDEATSVLRQAGPWFLNLFASSENTLNRGDESGSARTAGPRRIRLAGRRALSTRF
jgi:hypothetical protein